MFSRFWVQILQFFSEILKDICFAFILRWQPVTSCTDRILGASASKETLIPMGQTCQPLALNRRWDKSRRTPLRCSDTCRCLFCPWFQLLLQMPRHFDAKLWLDPRGSSWKQCRCRCFCQKGTAARAEETEEISLIYIFFFLTKSQYQYGTSFPDFYCQWVRLWIKMNDSAIASGDSGTAGPSLVHLQTGSEAAKWISLWLCQFFSTLVKNLTGSLTFQDFQHSGRGEERVKASLWHPLLEELVPVPLTPALLPAVEDFPIH